MTSLHVNELLCYNIHKQGKISAKQLKIIVNNFYSLEAISSAKDVLVALVDAMDIRKWPRPARYRKNSIDGGTENKNKFDIGDIVDGGYQGVSYP